MNREPSTPGSKNHCAEQPSIGLKLQNKPQASLGSAAFTGLVSGVARAVVDWLLSQVSDV